MGGDIVIESKKGQGATFRCTIQCDNLLPQEQEKAQAKLAQELMAAPSQPTQKLTILVVDDNAINRKMLGFNLTKAGHSCLFAVDGYDAIAQYTQHPVDIILMDIIMPQLDGISAAREIRRLEQERQLPHVPIIALTGNALEAQRQEAQEAGMEDYATKPYKLQDLLGKIAAFFPPAEKPPSAANSLIVSRPRQDAPPQTFWRPPASETLKPVSPARIWMAEPLRKILYPLLDRLSAELNLLNIHMAMPDPRFQDKISTTGWQLYSMTGKEEHWAVLNLTQETQADKLVAAIQQSGSQLQAKKMKSGAAHAVAIVFSTNLTLSTEIDKMIPPLRTLFNPSLTRA